MRFAHYTSPFAFLGLVSTLCLVELWIVKSIWFPLNTDVLSFAVTVDLTLGIPALYYLMLVRPHRSPAITLAPLFLAALMLAHMILPSSSQFYLERVEYLLPLVEGSALLVGVLKARAIVRHYHQARPTTVYASDAFAASLRHALGSSRLIGLLVTELSMPYYVVCGWFQSFHSTNPANVPISCHRKSGYGAVIAMFAGLLALETIGLHLLIQHWSPGVALALTGLSVYSLIWIVGDYHAVRLHPIVLGTRTLSICSGFRWRVDVAWTNVVALSRATPGKKPAQSYLNAAVYGEPRFVLQLREPVIAYGLFGMEKHVTRIGLTVDDEPLFQTELNKRMSTECDLSTRPVK